MWFCIYIIHGTWLFFFYNILFLFWLFDIELKVFLIYTFYFCALRVLLLRGVATFCFGGGGSTGSTSESEEESLASFSWISCALAETTAGLLQFLYIPR